MENQRQQEIRQNVGSPTGSENIYESFRVQPPERPRSTASSSSGGYYGASVGSYRPSSTASNNVPSSVSENHESRIDELTKLLMHSMQNNEVCFGICSRCSQQVVGEGTGCSAMGKLFHIKCFTCRACNCPLQGKSFFYHVDGKPYCEEDYLARLEKCSVCNKTVTDRILRANGKPYHPSCFTCVVCSKSLEGIQFTIDAANRIYCIEDFHRKFAPRCSVCKNPIMPKSGEEETVRVVALDRSFHLHCYKCEDCGLLLRSEQEGRGCYP